jgi:class 3 adenylate cyclase/tetratricopeptide (TPR) repeat protein
MTRCSSCGEDNPRVARFCLACGAAIASEIPVPQGARKSVTVVFSDIVGSTALAEGLDSESLREVLDLYFESMRTVLERHGGIVEKYIGDAIMAVFGLPRAHEDDALRATRAAAEMTGALAGLNLELERTWGVRLATRTGVNTGEIVVGDAAAGQRLATGDAVNVAARLEQSAPPERVLLGATTYQLVKDAVAVEAAEPLSLKGKALPVDTFRLVGVRPGAPGVARRLNAPLIGRAEELARLMEAFDRVEIDCRCLLMTVLGDAGVGKSRLADELGGCLAGRAKILHGRCLSYGEGITFWPVAEVVKSAAVITDGDSVETARKAIDTLLAGTVDAHTVGKRVEALIGLSAAPYPIGEIFWAVRKLLERVAMDQPTVVIFEDVHWGEPTFLDLVEHCIKLMTDAPILIVCSARPDLLDTRPDWGTNHAHVECLFLEPLSALDSDILADSLLDASALSAEARIRIRNAAEGNPLFVEQIVSMWIDDGILRSDDGRWVVTGDFSRASVPPTISALLTARLDRLDDDERAVIEGASVIGQGFYREALHELCWELPPQTVDRALATLTAKKLIRIDSSTFAGERAFTFSHGLIRDAAYQGTLKRIRAQRHERFVLWLERAVGERIKEYEEIAGYHLEQAYRLLAELAPVGERSRKLAERAGRHLGKAGRSAYERADIPAAVNMLRRAISLIPPSDSERLLMMCTLADALKERGEFVEAETVLAEVREHALDRGDQGLEAYVSLIDLRVQKYAAPKGWAHRARNEIDRLAGVFEESGDERGLAWALTLLSDIHWYGCRAGNAEAAAYSALSHAQVAGAVDCEAYVYARLPSVAAAGPTPANEALRHCENIHKRCGDHRAARSWVQAARAYLLAMTGQFDEARRLTEAAAAEMAELGMDLERAAVLGQSSFLIEMLADRPAAAERWLKESLDVLEGFGERGYLSTHAGMLANVLCVQGRYEEAEVFSQTSEDTADEDDILSQVLWLSARSKIRTRQGRLEVGERLGRQALLLIDGTDFTNDRANVRLDLAEVLYASSKSESAVEMARDSLRLYEQKGNLVAAAKARSLLAKLIAAEPG